MHFFNKKQVLESFISNLKSNKKTIGFVPTMGALHKGHISLLEFAQKENDIVVVSIFVNPTQFDNKNDLENYPKTFQLDKGLLQESNCDILFAPSVSDIYGNTIVSEQFDFEGLEKEMEGKYRDNHFNGVGTIVKTLFEIVKPDNAYFGEKDFQQLRVIEQLSKALALNTKIIGCPIIREPDGLAMSSRNQLLGVEDRKKAPMIFQLLQLLKAQSALLSYRALREIVHDFFKKNDSLKLDYFVICDPKTLQEIDFKQSPGTGRAFIAVYLGKIRLIDNLDMS